jgi:hypothetical protein
MFAQDSDLAKSYSNNKEKTTGRTWQLGCHRHSWFITGNTRPTELSGTCSRFIIPNFNLMETQSQCNLQNGSISHDLTGIIMDFSKLLHESRLHGDYCMSFQAFNQPPPTGTTPTFHHSWCYKINTSSCIYRTTQHLCYPELILTIGLFWLARGNLIDIHLVCGMSFFADSLVL